MVTTLQHKLLVDVAKLARSPLLADIHLKFVNEQGEEDADPVAAHKFVLGTRSPVFLSMFTNGMKECVEQALHITIQFKRQDFLKILDFLYTGNIDLDHETVVETLAIADFYGLEDVRKMCVAFVVDNIALLDCMEVLQYVSQYDRLLSDFCLRYISTHSREALYSPCWEYCTEEMVIEILKLNLHMPETEILDAVVRWAKASLARDGESTLRDSVAKKITNALKHIRFGTMLPSQLTEIEKMDLVSKEMLFDAYRFLATDRSPTHSIQTQFRASSVRLDYPRHGRHHKRGLFSYLGGIQNAQYINPADSGNVLITASSVAEGNLSEFIARVPTPHTLLCTTKEPFSWIAVDLGPNYVFCPSDYSLRFGGERQGAQCAAPKKWMVQGSNDGSEWHVISNHVNDASLKDRHGENMWEVKSVEFFRHFRVLQTGKNQRGAYELSVCCFELYGLLCILSPEEAAPPSRISFGKELGSGPL